MGILDNIKHALAFTTDTLAGLTHRSPTLSALTMVPRPDAKPKIGPEGPFLLRDLLALRSVLVRHHPDSANCPDRCPDGNANAFAARRFPLGPDTDLCPDRRPDGNANAYGTSRSPR